MALWQQQQGETAFSLMHGDTGTMAQVGPGDFMIFKRRFQILLFSLLTDFPHCFSVEREVKVKVTQSCPTLCDSMDYRDHEILQARILAWVAVPFSTQGLNPGLHCRRILYQLCHQGSPCPHFFWSCIDLNNPTSSRKDRSSRFCLVKILGESL